MKLVIDIPEKYKDLLDKGEADGSIRKSILLAVSNGTPLPKGHGRLIDADVFEKDLITNGWITSDDGGGLEDILFEAPTIIEADGGDVE